MNMHVPAIELVSLTKCFGNSVEPAVNSSKVSFLKTDLTDIRDVEKSLKGVDVVYHLAGVVLKGMKQKK